jgi:hypothetical protein
MNITDLPAGSAPAPIPLPHFPTRFQAVLWRNWGLVTPEKLAEMLHCTVSDILNSAEKLGLPTPPEVHPKWVTHGYLTLIRNNWHLLPYSQILQMLDWTPEKMAYTLKEEDFFWHKLGQLKPECKEVFYRELSPEEEAATTRIREIMSRYFRPEELLYQDQPFAFADRFAPQESTGEDRFEFNYIHSYSASCGDVLGNADLLDPVPENLLAQYASMGIRGVWFHALLYLLIPIPGAEEYSIGAEKRMEQLKKLVERGQKYGIRIYLYLNEPRSMPLSFYDKMPHWGGLDQPEQLTKTNCTTRTGEPLAYLEHAMYEVFRQVPGLGGAFCITMSENTTNCHCRLQSRQCPSCSKVPPEKIIADVVTAMEKGMHRAAPSARMIAYDWAWKEKAEDVNTVPFRTKVMDLLPESVYVCSVSEWGLHTNIAGVEQDLVDYSISQIGPSPASSAVWAHARKTGRKIVAKMQLNNSWELSAVPYMPVPYLVEEHLNRLKNAGVSGIMASWTLGGFPDGNLKLLAATPEELAQAQYHTELAEKVCCAWKQFSEAFRNFPFHVNVLYVAPMNYGPMNLLHREPTGYRATMVGFPYDDLESWRSLYPQEIFLGQMEKITAGWRAGLQTLTDAAGMVQPEEAAAFNDLQTIAEAAYCHLQTTVQQIRFVMARQNGDGREMQEMIRQERDIALKLYNIVRRDSRIGFEASNHYYYTLNDLREKVLSCELMLEKE